MTTSIAEQRASYKRLLAMARSLRFWDDVAHWTQKLKELDEMEDNG